MLILAKTTLAIMLGFVISVIVGFILIPILKKIQFTQKINTLINERHMKKQGTPTLGGLIFIIPVILALILLYIRGSITISHNLVILVFVFLSYAALGFLDDFLKMKRHDEISGNEGLKSWQKFVLQVLIAIVFYFIYRSYGGTGDLTLSFFGWNFPMGWAYGLFILLVLVATTNAVNISDGLDGLAGGLSICAFAAFGLMAWNTTWCEGYQELAIFAFLLIGALGGFLLFNAHPAKVFMGDTGSLALGGALATLAILTRHEFSLILVGGVFVVETLSSLIQIIAIRKFKKKVFLKAPLHHHFEELGWDEVDIVRLFWAAGFILAMFGIIYGVWL